MNCLKEFDIPYINNLLIIASLVCIILYAFNKKGKYNLPPGPKGLPLVGILPFLGDSPHLKLTEYSKEYGGIFGAYMGRRFVVVVTDAEASKQLLKKSSTANRPPHSFQCIPGGVGLEELNGQEWIEQRRYTITELKNLGFGRSYFEKLVQVEITEFLDILERTQGKPFDVYDAISASVSNNILSLVTNHRLPMGDPRRVLIDNGVKSFEAIHNPSGFMIYFPTLFSLAYRLGLLKIGQKLKSIETMCKYIREEIEEVTRNKDGHSFINNYVAEIEKNKSLNLQNSFNETNLLGNVQALITAGGDTSKVSLLWIFLAMASFPLIQEKIHEELDRVLGKDGSIDWSDRQKLSYCLATVMEGQRWRTVVPLNLLHRTNEDIVIDTYDIPKGTDILTVIWAFHNDLKYWKEPENFDPQRFMSEDGTVKEPEYFMPFSSGKRVCPGKTVALIELFHYFVSAMQRFKVVQQSDTVLPDLTGIAGLTLEPKRQALRFIQRHNQS